jgi:hypothetical protein
VRGSKPELASSSGTPRPVARDDVVLIVGRQRRQVVVAEDRPHREVGQQRELAPSIFGTMQNQQPTGQPRLAIVAIGLWRAIASGIVAADLGHVGEKCFIFT